MPFDGTKKIEATEDLSFVPGHEGLRRLAVLLRREMPENFLWDFSVVRRCDFFAHDGGLFYNSASSVYATMTLPTPCRTAGCAIGLAMETWPAFAEALEQVSDRRGPQKVAALFDLPAMVTHDIFFDTYGLYGKPADQVTATDVADAIDRYLEDPLHAVERRATARIARLLHSLAQPPRA